MRVTYWNPDLAKEIVTKEAMIRLEKAGKLLAAKVQSNLNAAIKNKTYSRPVYKGGYVNGHYVLGAVNAGKWWTAREAGQLSRSVRTALDYEGIHHNILIIAGNATAYYPAMFEYAKTTKRGKPFFRPAIASTRSAMKAVLENG